ncbi:MAG: hypothetical protein LHW64_10045 [Candidatus Cloacimonetes bacterium]|nr:hypothetical protein [Candidatus Cloacimonadota bacterium]MCB5288125.1 hypothetical protein [Candidatus Cloacimonadota bacterium]MCK9185184.1 hypothetical protein [Candidatus Cloacimonadota bacterium]MCK9583424.1 hypothetical protein [Candidatus Cloacimonadota bacterium]MDY0230449.1 hypothetical protein [Candidatus Cloacimonadaceae bacterium]
MESTAGAVQSLDTHQLKLMERPDKSSVTMRYDALVHQDIEVKVNVPVALDVSLDSKSICI